MRSIQKKGKIMRKHFISILGTGNYEKAVYYCEKAGEKAVYETSYIQEAVLKLKFDEWNEDDRITVFVTEKSMARNWEDYTYSAKEREDAGKKGITLPEKNKGLKGILEKEYEPYLDKIDECIIPVGATEDELWSIFQIMYSHIGDGEELYIDITHSLRNIPIQMLSVIAFARVVKKVTVSGIYYGAFEVGNRNEQGIKEAPIFDLITFLDILDWSQAAASFVKYGDSDQIVDLYRKNSKRLPSKAIELYKIISELQNITRGLETSRGYCNPNLIRENQERGRINSGISSGNSTLESYFAYKKFYKELMKKDREQDNPNQQKNMIKPLGELMNVINDDVRNFNVESNLDLGLAAIKWAIDHKRTQQGFTALEETIKTFLCSYYGLDETKEAERELGKHVGNALARQKQKEQVRELTQEVRERAYEEWKEWNKGKTDEECQKAYEIIMDIPLEMVETIHNVGQCRNSMNHFGYSNAGQFSGEKLEKNLKKYYYNFVDNMMQMKEKNSRSESEKS